MLRKVAAAHSAWALAAAALLVGGVRPSLAAPPAASPHSDTASPRSAKVVTIDGLRFDPEVLVVAPGERITWINKDPFPHTVTAADKGFDSGQLAAGASWSFTARSAGTYPYGCLLHPTMKGKLIVRAQTNGQDHQ